ncbi:MAG: hypothetical protein P4L50_18045 [Anaerolineaceae bacterium]|nr:hypothetical protein [Anaerolineaceae bacterium]
MTENNLEIPPAALNLETRHIPYRVFRHTQPVNSIEESAGGPAYEKPSRLDQEGLDRSRKLYFIEFY